MLVVDVSASGDFGSREQMKGELAIELCAVLAFSAIKNNDKVGLIIFSDRIEKFVPPRKGRGHVLRVLRELFYHEPEGRRTDLRVPLEYMSRVLRRRSVAFVVSDFLADDFQKSLAVASRKHDVIAVRMGDRREAELPPMGFVEFEDPETGRHAVVNTSSKAFRERYQRIAERVRADQDQVFRRSGVDVIDIRTGRPYVQPLMRFFKERARRIR